MFYGILADLLAVVHLSYGRTSSSWANWRF